MRFADQFDFADWVDLRFRGVEELDLEDFLADSREFARLVGRLAFLPFCNKKERVERVLKKEILEITIPRNFKKSDGSSIRSVPVRGVVT